MLIRFQGGLNVLNSHQLYLVSDTKYSRKVQGALLYTSNFWILRQIGRLNTNIVPVTRFALFSTNLTQSTLSYLFQCSIQSCVIYNRAARLALQNFLCKSHVSILGQGRNGVNVLIIFCQREVTAIPKHSCTLKQIAIQSMDL